MKPALARGDLRAIGATTPEEYQRYIMQDAALERRFQQIWVPEPRPEEALEMLRGVKARYETHHGVAIADEALEAAVKLSVAWLPDRHLPVPQGARSPGRSLRLRPDPDDQQIHGQNGGASRHRPHGRGSAGGVERDLG